jgi:hypothetical protein
MFDGVIAPILHGLKRQYPASADWTLESVRHLLEIGEYYLLTFDDAFLIVEGNDDYLHGVIAAAYSGHVMDFAAYVVDVASFAKQLGYHGFTFTSPRIGWDRTAITAGFKILSRETTYLYEI